MTVRLGLVGAGLVGARHADAIGRAAGAELAAVVDPSDDAMAAIPFAGFQRFADMDALLAARLVDGVIIATPNRLHADQAMSAIAAGLPALIEKPLTDEVSSGEAVVAAAEAAGVPLLTGHHRRYNPIIEKAGEMIRSGGIGQVLSVQSSCWLKKPDDYFEADWRRRPGAGPVLVNLIHDVDLLRFFCGEVISVQAMAGTAARGHEVEDCASCLLRFASGALATMSVSDAIPAPVSWELTAGENPAYPAMSESCYWIGGTEGTLSLPQLTLWKHQGPEGWWSPLGATRFPVPFADPLVAQVAHFADVIRNGVPPRVSGADGLAATRVIAAILQAAETGAPVAL